MIKKCRESLDQGGAYGVLLTELSKAFDCLHHELHIAKPHVYGLDMASVKVIRFYLTKRKHESKLMMFIALRQK